MILRMGDFDRGTRGGFHEYYRQRLEKLREQFLIHQARTSDGQPVKDVFKGKSFWINGFTVPPFNELKKISAENGGILDFVYTK